MANVLVCIKRVPDLGGEISLTADGMSVDDTSLGAHVLMAYLPPDQAEVGNGLAVSYMEELYPVTVGSVDSTPLFYPSNERISG